MMVEAGVIPAICLRFASPMMISLSLGRQIRYAIFSGRSMQRSEPTRCANRRQGRGSGIPDTGPGLDALSLHLHFGKAAPIRIRSGIKTAEFAYIAGISG
jgi:hypothetical protein